MTTNTDNKNVMTKYFVLPLLAISCHSKLSVIPKAGEVWRVTKPFIGDVTIDSINRFGNICFHDNDSLQRTGICAPEYFEGECRGLVKPISEGPITEKESQ